MENLTVPQMQQDHANAKGRIEDGVAFGPQYDERVAKAFSAGADARLAGQLAAPPASKHELGRHWMYGWKHADKYFGIDVAGRWPYLKLPPIRKTA